MGLFSAAGARTIISPLCSVVDGTAVACQVTAADPGGVPRAYPRLSIPSSDESPVVSRTGRDEDPLAAPRLLSKLP